MAGDSTSAFQEDPIQGSEKSPYRGKPVLKCPEPDCDFKQDRRPTLSNKYAIWRHLGAVHFKLEEILESEKRRPLRSAVMPRIMKVSDENEEE